MSFSSLSINKNRAVNDLSKYVIGVSINKQEEPSGILSGTAVMGGISGAAWTFKNRKDLKGGFKNLAKDAQTQKDIVNSANKYSKSSILGSVRNKWAGATDYTSKKELEALSQQLSKKPEYANLKNYIDNNLKLGKNFSATLKNVDKLKAIENLNKYNAKVAAQTASGSTFRAIKNATGLTKLSKATKELAVKSGKFRGLLKGVKGNIGFALFSLGAGVISDVIPAFQLGTDKGFKQLGKTAAKTGCEVAGWAAGSALGAKAGAVIGTCIGGPVGTVVGGAIGLIGGFVGSFLASKAADKVIGPSEVELAQTKSAEDIAKTARTSPETLNELTLESYTQLVEKAKNGELTEDDMKAKEALEELIGCKINLENEVQASISPQQEEATADATRVETPNVEENTKGYRQLDLSKVGKQDETEAQTEEELANEKEGIEDKTTNPSVSAQTPQISNAYAMAINPFNNMYFNATLPNANTNAYNTYTNPYSNDMYYNQTFGYPQTPQANQSNGFKYIG